MKIFNREEFMKLPEGVIFCKGQPWAFGDINVKGETINQMGKNIDFYCTDFNWVEGNNSGECFDRLEEMLKDGKSYPMTDPECYGRDGCFEDKDIFLLFEPDDLRRLVEVILKAIPITTSLNN